MIFHSELSLLTEDITELWYRKKYNKMLRDRSGLEKLSFVLQPIPLAVHFVLYGENLHWGGDANDKTQINFVDRCFQPFEEKGKDCAKYVDIFESVPDELAAFQD